MSEKIQIVFGGTLSGPELEDDSKNAFMCHKPPNISVAELMCGASHLRTLPT